MMFGKKSRLERENDALEERIVELQKQVIFYSRSRGELELKYLRNLREYRYTQKACERRKRANKRLRAMLNDVGWPKNDLKPVWVNIANKKSGERSVPKKVKLP